MVFGAKRSFDNHMKEEQKKIMIFGAGGHVKVVLGIIEAEGKYEVLGLLDDDENKHGSSVFGVPVLGGRKEVAKLKDKEISKSIVAIGDNLKRAEVADFMKRNSFHLVRTIHPSATILRGVKIGEGTVLLPNAYVGADAMIGPGVILSVGAVVGHDCEIGSWVHLGVGAKLAGNVRVGDFSFIGMGAALLPGVEVGRRVIIGANAVVNDNIPDNVTAVGVPIRILEK